MTTTGEIEDRQTRRGSGKAKEPAPKSTPVASRVRNKPRPAIIALAIAIIIVAGLAAAYIYTNTGRTTEVFSAGKSITRGEVIQSTDLTTVEIPIGQKIPSFPQTQADSVIGKTAKVDIPQGTLISPNNVTSGTGLPANTSIVGVSLTASQLPPYPLASGDNVRLVNTPVNQGDPPTQTPATIKAKVVSVSKDDVKGTTTVAVAVDTDKAADLAARAATGRVALILDSEGN